MLNDEPEFLCEENRCLMEQDVIDRVNLIENNLWVARNYTEFYGHTLDEGLKLRLGTQNPSQSVHMFSSYVYIYILLRGSSI